jgi:hypothetical protein
MHSALFGLTLGRKQLNKCIILDLKEANVMIPKARAPKQHVGNQTHSTLIDENASQYQSAKDDGHQAAVRAIVIASVMEHSTP